ncbi:MAG: hypothetical protein LBJ40_15445 [Delftia acidovorans]|jgi:hypothetical protein|nr:hypothetical protein [Delftia acidovorans]
MAGLLDFLSAPESQLGLGLLAAAGSGQKFGPGLLSAVQYADSQRKGDLQQKLLQAQMDNYQSEIEARKLASVKDARQQAWIERLMGGSPTQGQGAGFVGAGGSPGAASGGGMSAPGAGGQGGGILELARSLGIPEQAIQADMAFNGGKGIAAMIEKNGGRDMQVTNGYAYDKNRLGAGFMPSLTTSQDGKTSMTRIGPDGMPIISAPQGALETFNNYQSAQANYKPIKVYNPATGREEYTSEGAVVRGNPAGRTQPDARSPAYAGGSRSAAVNDQIEILRWEMNQPGRTQAEKDGNAREIARLQGLGPRGQTEAPTSLNYAAGPSAQETARNESNRAFGTNLAKLDSEQLDNWRKGAEASHGILSTVDSLRRADAQGAYSGGGSQAKLAASSIINGLTGYTPKGFVGSELYNSEAKKLILDKIKTLGANPSNADREFIEKTVPQLNTSSEARARMADFMERKAAESISLYQQADAYARQNSSLGGFNQFQQPQRPASPQGGKVVDFSSLK